MPDENKIRTRTFARAPPASYRTPARGGLMMAPPATATITAITTINMVSIVFPPNALIRQDA
jgi:hypothetical protein